MTKMVRSGWLSRARTAGRDRPSRPARKTTCTRRSTRFSTPTCATDSCITSRCRKSAGALDRYMASLDVPRAKDRRVAQGRSGSVLGQRLQRARPADRHRRLSDQGKVCGVSRQEHPADSWRVRATEAPRRPASCSTLDEIEKNVIAKFGDARLLLALGRGAIGSGRLRSEAYQAPHARRAARAW